MTGEEAMCRKKSYGTVQLIYKGREGAISLSPLHGRKCEEGQRTGRGGRAGESAIGHQEASSTEKKKKTRRR